MKDRAYLPRRPRGKAVYGVLIVLLVLASFFLQFQWMKRVRQTGAKDVVPPVFAEQLTRWMLQKKGLATEPVSLDGSGAEKIHCENCMGSGQIPSGSGEKEICPFCQGVGFHLVRRFDPSDRICPFCAGMGRVELPDAGAVGACPRCEGRGLIRRPAADPAQDGI